MQEVESRTVEIKTNDDHRDKFFLVHDGSRVIGFGSGSTRAAVPADKIMLVGTEAELTEEIDRLKLAPEINPFEAAKEAARKDAQLNMQTQ